MSYLKGKDIKVPFDCLWHCYTRSFQATSYYKIPRVKESRKPEDFDKW
jgi:hypothetical protein